MFGVFDPFEWVWKVLLLPGRSNNSGWIDLATADVRSTFASNTKPPELQQAASSKAGSHWRRGEPASKTTMLIICGIATNKNNLSQHISSESMLFGNRNYGHPHILQSEQNSNFFSDRTCRKKDDRNISRCLRQMCRSWIFPSRNSRS